MQLANNKLLLSSSKWWLTAWTHLNFLRLPPRLVTARSLRRLSALNSAIHCKLAKTPILLLLNRWTELKCRIQLSNLSCLCLMVKTEKHFFNNSFVLDMSTARFPPSNETAPSLLSPPRMSNNQQQVFGGMPQSQQSLYNIQSQPASRPSGLMQLEKSDYPFSDFDLDHKPSGLFNNQDDLLHIETNFYDFGLLSGRVCLWTSVLPLLFRFSSTWKTKRPGRRSRSFLARVDLWRSLFGSVFWPIELPLRIWCRSQSLCYSSSFVVSS